MSSDRTQHQSTGEQSQSRDLSLEPSRPPTEVPGYNIKSFLGSGAFGEVWSAIDQKTGRRVAIKFYTRRSSTDLELLAREVQKLAVLAADRYVVQLLDVGWEANPPYYVMDYVENGSLEDRLRAQKTLPTAEAVELFKEISNGMMHLHAKGILHCDLKPGNVLLDQDGKPRVADFGQSRLSNGDTPALGTLFYMAPEQADITAVPDAGWDVYGLGALLYCMLVGKPPYYSRELAENIEGTENFTHRLESYQQSLLLAPAPTEHKKVRGVDRQLADIIDRCIAADPNKRFASIQSVMLALRQRELIRARRPLLVLGLIGPLLLMTVISLFGLSAYNRAITETETAIKERTFESKDFAARFAARSAANQIDEYFRVVRQLANDPTFKKTFTAVVGEKRLYEDWLDQLSDPNKNADKSLDPLRTAFIGDPLREQLDPFLNDRINDTTGDYPEAASWLIYDRSGNQLAARFKEKVPNNTIGKNYSYRSYFTGAPRDLKSKVDNKEVYDVNEIPDERLILEGLTVSAVFESRANSNWKIAFSAPVIIEDEIKGIVAVTVEMGNFVEFDNEDWQYVMLVDGRSGGDYEGVILEHPLYDEIIEKQGESIPAELTPGVRIDFDLVRDKVKKYSFEDPVSTTTLGSKYGGRAIVAEASVDSTRMARDKTKKKDKMANGDNADLAPTKCPTGLIVLALEDYESAFAAVRVLSRQLGFLAFVAAFFLLAVVVAMWFLVLRMLRDSRRRLERVFAPSADSNSIDSRQIVGEGTVRPDDVTVPHDSNPNP